jgi:hypothetical protein
MAWTNWRAFSEWLEQVRMRTTDESSPVRRGLVHGFKLAGNASVQSEDPGTVSASAWYAAADRTTAEREAFALLLLQLDADPAKGAHQPDRISKGCRTIGFKAKDRRFGVVYQIIAADNTIRIVSISTVS